MSNELMLDVGQANEIKMAARKGGATNADLKALCQPGMFAQILPVLRGEVRVKIPIDTDPLPYHPDKIVSHMKLGVIEWDPEKIELYQSPHQRGNRKLMAKLLYEKVANRALLNNNVLHFLLAHKYLIPKEWEGKCIFFMGSRYYRGHGEVCWIDYLYYNRNEVDWRFGSCTVTSDLDCADYVAVLKA